MNCEIHWIIGCDNQSKIAVTANLLLGCVTVFFEFSCSWIFMNAVDLHICLPESLSIFLFTFLAFTQLPLGRFPRSKTRQYFLFRNVHIEYEHLYNYFRWRIFWYFHHPFEIIELEIASETLMFSSEGPSRVAAWTCDIYMFWYAAFSLKGGYVVGGWLISH